MRSSWQSWSMYARGHANVHDAASSDMMVISGWRPSPSSWLQMTPQDPRQEEEREFSSAQAWVEKTPFLPSPVLNRRPLSP